MYLKSYQNNHTVAYKIRLMSDCGCRMPNLKLKRLVHSSIHTLVSRENTELREDQQMHSNEKTVAKYLRFWREMSL